ncbi:hypothetical protein N0V88_001580 [Collariella sp. IMI 366227]|nr:hypothetical protein N0V88_001580 [Collariella sp. IMI 366227]
MQQIWMDLRDLGSFLSKFASPVTLNDLLYRVGSLCAAVPRWPNLTKLNLRYVPFREDELVQFFSELECGKLRREPGAVKALAQKAVCSLAFRNLCGR